MLPQILEDKVRPFGSLQQSLGARLPVLLFVSIAGAFACVYASWADSWLWIGPLGGLFTVYLDWQAFTTGLGRATRGRRAPAPRRKRLQRYLHG